MKKFLTILLAFALCFLLSFTSLGQGMGREGGFGNTSSQKSEGTMGRKGGFGNGVESRTSDGKMGRSGAFSSEPDNDNFTSSTRRRRDSERNEYGGTTTTTRPRETESRPRRSSSSERRRSNDDDDDDSWTPIIVIPSTTDRDDYNRNNDWDWNNSPDYGSGGYSNVDMSGAGTVLLIIFLVVLGICVVGFLGYLFVNRPR